MISLVLHIFFGVSALVNSLKGPHLEMVGDFAREDMEFDLFGHSESQGSLAVLMRHLPAKTQKKVAYFLRFPSDLNIKYVI